MRTGHALAEGFRGEHFDVGTEFQDLHEELAVIRVGDLEHVAPVFLHAVSLVGVPPLRRHPTSGFRGEFERRPLDLAAGEDAVAAAQVLIELGLQDFLRFGVPELGMLDGVDGEAPEVVAQVAPSVEVPIVAVVDEALRGDFAFGGAVFAAVVVPDEEPRTLEEGRRDDAEPGGVTFSALGLEDADPLLDFLPGMITAPEDSAQPLDQCAGLGAEVAGLEVAKELEGGEEGVDFGGVEPETGELVTGAGAGFAETIGVDISDVFDRGVEAVAHVYEVALQSGARYA